MVHAPTVSISTFARVYMVPFAVLVCAVVLTLWYPPKTILCQAKGVATIVPVSSMAHFTSYPDGILGSIEAMNNESVYDRAMACKHPFILRNAQSCLSTIALLVSSIWWLGLDTPGGLPNASSQLCSSRFC